MGKPKWFKYLKNIVKSFGRPTRKRGRDYYDIESLVRNVPEKESVRQKKRGELVFTIIDTSGSMTMSANSGRTYMQELGKYIPKIVEDYDGEVIVIDTEIKYPIYSNKKIKKALKTANANANSMRMSGGGGTNMSKAYEYIIKKKREEKFEAIVILLTDGGLNSKDLPANMIQEIASTFLVMPQGELQRFEKKHSKFMGMVQSEQYPAVQIIAIDFKNEE
jgi:predicted metal-dependent peptidase